MMRTVAFLPLALTLMGCGGGDPYIAQLAGNWVGTAEAPNGPVPVEAQFMYMAEQPRPFSGELLLDESWIFYATGPVTSDNKSATITLILNTEAHSLTLEAELEEENQMVGNYTRDLCYADAKGQDPAKCTETGSFNLTK